jgi:hypothetical protein
VVGEVVMGKLTYSRTGTPRDWSVEVIDHLIGRPCDRADYFPRDRQCVRTTGSTKLGPFTEVGARRVERRIVAEIEARREETADPYYVLCPRPRSMVPFVQHDGRRVQGWHEDYEGTTYGTLVIAERVGGWAA